MNNSYIPGPELTPNGLQSLIEEQKKGTIVQILSSELLPERKPGVDSLKYKVVISDGFAKHKAVFGNRAALIYQKAKAPVFCVVRIDEITQLNVSLPKKLIIITDLTILDQTSNQVIGYPVEYQSWLDQASMYENLASRSQHETNMFTSSLPAPTINNNSNNNMFTTSSLPIEFEEKIAQFAFPRADKPARKLFAPEVMKPQPLEELSSKKASPIADKSTNNTIVSDSTSKKSVQKPKESSPIEVRRNPEQLTSTNKFTSTSKKVSESTRQRAMQQINNVSVMGVQIREFGVGDLSYFHEQTDKGQAFSADFFDKDGNRVSAVFYGENVDNFISLLNGNNTHVLTNINTKMEIESQNPK